MTDGGEGTAGAKGQIPWNKGKKMPEEFRQKIKESCKTRKAHSPESHKKQGEKMCGSKHSDESKEKMSKMLKKAWQTREKKDPWNKGKTLCNEIKQKISQTLKGTICSEETRKKMSEGQFRAYAEGRRSGFKKGQIPWNIGKHRSEETKKKISESLKGNIPWNKGMKRKEKCLLIIDQTIQ